MTVKHFFASLNHESWVWIFPASGSKTAKLSTQNKASPFLLLLAIVCPYLSTDFYMISNFLLPPPFYICIVSETQSP